MFFSVIHFFEPFPIFYIPHNYVIPQAVPHAIPQTHSSFYPHRNMFSSSVVILGGFLLVGHSRFVIVAG